MSAATAGAARASDHDSSASPPKPTTFDLVTEAWLPVLRTDGVVEEVSLLGLFERAGELRRLVGDVPTQEMALLRLLLAILYDAFDGPAELEDWEDLWLADAPFAPVAEYLHRHRDRFDLFHPERPFYQVAGLRTAKGEVAPLARIVADVPVGDPFFSMRRPGVERLGYAEAARWLVHAHAYDTSGIKPAMVGDEARAKAGKVYPLGVGPLGNLGGVFAEGGSLRETLLLNLLPFEEIPDWLDSGGSQQDRPVWRRDEPPGPAADSSPGRPYGLRDLYTWQSRRVRLHAEDGAVTGVVLGYGDPLTHPSPWRLEPMSAWRSPVQKKKEDPAYVPLRHDPSRAAWRGLAALLPARSQPPPTGKGAEPQRTLRSGVTRWFTRLTTESEIDPGKLVRLRLVGVVYGTQQSVIDEIVDDSVVLPVITLHERNEEYGAAALDGAVAAEEAVGALGQLAANLAQAAGTDQAPPKAAARDLGFGTLDGPYRAWLKDLLGFPNLQAAKEEWRDTVRRHVWRLAQQLLDSAGPAADEGRLVAVPQRDTKLLIDASRAELWFRRRLVGVLGAPANGQTPGRERGDGPETENAS